MEGRTINFLLWFTSLFIIVSSLGLETSKTETYRLAPGDPKACYSILNDKELIRYESLPGNGWDNLRNRDAGVVVNFNYTKCKTTDDGRYIIPDTVYTVPLKTSRVETYAELFDHWKNYTSTTSSAINIGADLTTIDFGISGSFSYESESVRKHQVNDKAVTTRVQVRYVRYTAKLQPDTPLHPTFKARLLSIASHILLNNTNMAIYESELLVRDFGTHVVTSVDAGAALVQIDDIKSSFNRDYSASKSKITASASASFFGVFKISASYDHQTSKEMIDQYLGNRSYSKIESYGGPVFKPLNFSLNDWVDAIGNDLVALDRSGDPLYFLVTPYLLPELPHSVMYKLIQSVKSAIEVYYKFNTYRGCMNPDSEHFSFQANVDDGNCKAPYTNFTFGGVYQTCNHTGVLSMELCKRIVQKNPLTGDFSCPSNYESALIGTFKRSFAKCFSSWWHRRCDSAMYTAYWCAARGKVDEQSGFLFGGLYTSTVSNTLTQAKSCPLHFYPLKIGSDLKICVSDDYELGFAYSVPFAGLYSCKTGNPLMLQDDENKDKNTLFKSAHKLTSYIRSSGSDHWPKGCPSGFSQHLATVESSCEINYCVKTGAFSQHGLPPVRRPPFVDLPLEGFTNSFLYPDVQQWEKINDEIEAAGPKPKENAHESGNSGDSGLSKGAVAGISTVTILACLFAASVVIVKYRKYNSQYRPLTMSTRLNRTPVNCAQYGSQHEQL